MNQAALTTENISTNALATILGITERGVNKYLKKHNCPFETDSRGARLYNVMQLPVEYRRKLASPGDETLLPATIPGGSIATGYNAKTAWGEESVMSIDVLRDPQVARWSKIVQEATAKPAGWKKKEWIKHVADKHQVSWQTVYRKMEIYDKKGLTGLLHTKSNKGTPKAWSQEAIDFWIGLCLKREHRKIAKDALYYEMLAPEALRRGWKIGCYESALWWYDKKINPQLQAFQKGGSRALDNLLPPVLRNYSDLNPFELLVGDQHRFDFWVMDENTGEVFRPEGYFWQDLRTRCIYGGALDKKYDAYLIGLALRMGIKIFGPFGSIYTDNGKPELSQYVMGIMKDMRTLGLGVEREIDVPSDAWDDTETLNPCVILPGTHKKAIVKNAKAKMIEGTFNTVEGILRDHFHVPGYVKNLKAGSEEQDIDQAEIRKLAEAGKLLTFWEFASVLFKALDYYNKQKSHRGVLSEWIWRPKPLSATPMDCLSACCMEGWRPGVMSEQAVDLVFLPRDSRGRVVDRGRISFRNNVYEHEKLISLHGQRMEIRFDPLDPEWLLVFSNGEYVCTASPVEYSSMKNQELASRKIAEKSRIRKGFISEYRALTAAVPDYLEYSQIPKIEKAAALVGAEKKRRDKQIEEQNRTLTQEELATGMARLKQIESRPKRSKALPERPSHFIDGQSRYAWLIKYQALDGEINSDDRIWMNGFEAGLNDDQREYWDYQRQYATEA